VRVLSHLRAPRTEITELDAWGDRTPRTRIVAIGKAFDAKELNDRFDPSTQAV
jgi:hypothetical protein